MFWKTHPDDEEFLEKVEISEKKISEILSAHKEFQAYEIGEDNEGQLVIYTGLYRKEN